MEKVRGSGKKLGIAALLLLAAFLVSCGKGKNPVTTTPGGSAAKGKYLTAYGPTEYDSQDEAALFMSADQEGLFMTFYNLRAGKTYTLSYDGTTRFYDKYFQGITPGQLAPGLVANITFLKGKKHLNSFMISPDAWNHQGISRYELKAGASSMKIGGTEYGIGEDLKVFSEGKSAGLMDINPADKLSAWGLGHKVLSLSIEEGHGYLRLTGEEYFLGGWITVGERVIARVTKGMLLAVPEGKSDVIVENGGKRTVESINVQRNGETVLDLSDAEIEEVKTGRIIFTILPEGAVLKIDGELTDYAEPVPLEYGLHRLDLSAEGYESLTQYIRVAAEGANVSLQLEPERRGEGETGMSVSGNTALPGESVSGNASNTVSGNGESAMTPSNPAITYITEAQVGEDSAYRIVLEAPAGAEAYLDGSYVGVLPVDFAKVPGSHVITLRLEGYRTRSYTVEIDSSPKDVSFSFAPLNPIQ